jgi:type I restriction enzyme S subunit
VSALPKGWVRIPIDDTGEYINGFAFKPGHRETQGLPIIRIQNLTDESKPLNRTALQVPCEYHVATGDMLMSWSATLDVFIWRRELALVNQHIFKVVPDKRVIDERLLFHCLKLAIDQLLATEHLHGSTMKHINRGPFMAHEVVLPPRAEQTRIVAKLEELLSDLDAGVAELKAAQKKLGQYRQSLLKAAVEGALTAGWRAAQHTGHTGKTGKTAPVESGAQLLARILTERRSRWETRQLAKYQAQGKPPPKGWQSKYPTPVAPETTGLPALPVGWVWASLDSLIDDGPQNGLYLPATRYGHGCPILRIDDFQIGWARPREALNLVDAE